MQAHRTHHRNRSDHRLMLEDIELQEAQAAEDADALDDKTRVHFKHFHNTRNLTVFIVLALLALITIGVFTPHVWTTSVSPVISGDPMAHVDGKFTIDQVFSGQFASSIRPFRFLTPPSTPLKSHSADPGNYFTTENRNGEVNFLWKQLYDSDAQKYLGKSHFKYNDSTYEVASIMVTYDGKFAILGSNLEREYRHSSVGYYWLMDTEQQIIEPMFLDDLAKISYSKFSPGYNYIYLVKDNDIYVRKLALGKQPTQITNDGSHNIYNGKTDWIYEEEVLSSDSALWWAPDDSKFIFAKFNDTMVEDVTLTLYTHDEPHSDIRYIKYPLPGGANPMVTLFMFDMETGVMYSIDHSETWSDFVLYYGAWVGPDNFLFKITDRTSRYLEVKNYCVSENKLHMIRSVDMAQEFNGWVEKSKDILVVPPKETLRYNYGFVDIHEDPLGFNHLFYYPNIQETSGTQLTSGSWEVSGKGIVGYEYESDTIFFTANEIGPMSQHLYSVEIPTEHTEPELRVLQNPGNKDDFYEFDISSSGRYAVSSYSGPHLPIKKAGPLVDLLDLKSESQGSNSNQNNIIELTDNSVLQKTLETIELPLKSYKSMQLADVKINYVEIKPANLDKNKRYPLLVNVYGGPGSQTFTTRHSVSFEESVASGLDAIILQIEPRGTGGKGWGFRSWARQKLGYWEPRDIVEVTKKYIKDNNIDEDHVAIWGWSYGGFTTLKTVEYDMGQTFNYAMAVAPVTNWTFYDSIYTERYMSLPNENREGYSDIAVLKNLKTLGKLNSFLLAHGTADDNVHIQNTFQVVDKLNLLEIENYDLMIFPDSDHSITHHNAQKVIFKKLYMWLGAAFNS